MFHSTTTGHIMPRPPAPALRSLSDTLAEAWSLRWWMLAGGIAGLALAVAASQLLPPAYAATAQIFIDPQNLQLLERDLSPTTASGDAGVVLIESQARVMASESVLRAAAQALNLERDPEFIGAGNPLKAWFNRLSASDAPVDDLGRAVLALGRTVHIVRLDRTYVIDVHAESESATKAAAMANAVVDAYLGLRQSQRAEQAGEASSALAGRLAQLLARLDTAETAVERYKIENDIVEPGGQSLRDAEVGQANQAMLAAQQAVEGLVIELAHLRGLAADPVRLLAAPETSSSPDMVRLRADLQAAEGNVATLRATLGERHPSLLGASQRLLAVQTALNAEIDRLIAGKAVALERAREQAQNLALRFDGATTQLQGLDASRIRLRQLQREAEASRVIYEDALLRSRETAEQAQIDTLNAQVVSRATAPIERSFPPKPTLLLPLGLLVGAATAAGLALLRRKLGRA